MLRIYLPSSTDLKLCSDVPIIDFIDKWTFVTVFTSRQLGPNIWVLANGSKMICQHLGHLLGPGSQVLGPGSETQIPGPRTRNADLLLDMEKTATYLKLFHPQCNRGMLE